MARTETFVENCQTLNVNCFAVNHVPFCCWAATKERHKTHCKRNKICERCFSCRSVVQAVTKVHTVVQNLPVGAILNQFWKTRGQFQSHKNSQGELHPQLSKQTIFDQVSSSKKWLSTSPQEQLLDAGITCTSKECSRKGPKSDIWLSSTDFSWFQTQQQVETYPRSELTEQIPEIRLPK